MDGIGRKIFYVLLVMAVVIVAALLLSRWRGEEQEQAPAGLSEVPGETKSVILYFATRQADGLLSETREIAVREGLEEQVRGVLAALVLGPSDDSMVSAIPPTVEVLQVFWDEETQTLYVDFNRALISDHPGGSTGEYYTISTILRSISANFPQVRRLQFLVDGYPVETIAGHYAVNKPLEIERWR